MFASNRSPCSGRIHVLEVSSVCFGHCCFLARAEGALSTLGTAGHIPESSADLLRSEERRAEKEPGVRNPGNKAERLGEAERAGGRKRVVPSLAVRASQCPSAPIVPILDPPQHATGPEHVYVYVHKHAHTPVGTHPRTRVHSHRGAGTGLVFLSSPGSEEGTLFLTGSTQAP